MNKFIKKDTKKQRNKIFYQLQNQKMDKLEQNRVRKREDKKSRNHNDNRKVSTKQIFFYRKFQNNIEMVKKVLNFFENYTVKQIDILKQVIS